MPGPFGAGSRPARVRRPDQLKPPKGGGCCPMAAAVRSARRGRFRLARRYAALSVRLVAARLT
jgi:hypothetical protein